MITEISQLSRTNSTLVQKKRYAFRFAADRSKDSIINNQPGQDYLAFSDAYNHLCFVVCDGVGQSFFGDLGSRIIGEELLSWLEGLVQNSYATIEFEESLSTYLLSIQARAREQVSNYLLPDDLPDLHKEVLEEKRILGTQSMFIGGRIDLPGRDYPQGRIILVWMGDSRLRLWGPEGEVSGVLGDTFNTNERWSSISGPVNGNPHLFIDTLVDNQNKSKWTHILAYSDGLAALDATSAPLTNAQLDNLFDQLTETPTSDDISLFECWIGDAPISLELPLEKPFVIPAPEPTPILELPLEKPLAVPVPEPTPLLELPSTQKENVESLSPPLSLLSGDNAQHKFAERKPPQKSWKKPIIWIPIILITCCLLSCLGYLFVRSELTRPKATPTTLSTTQVIKAATLRPSVTLTIATSITPTPTSSQTPTSTQISTATLTSTASQTTTPTLTSTEQASQKSNSYP